MSKSIASKILWLVPLAWAPGACSTDGPVDIGHDGAELSDYAASWDGYGEVASFPESGSDRVRLILHANGEGTLELGDIAPLPPPTQAEGGYLIDTGAGGRGGTPTDAFRDGFKYPVYEARVEAGRIRFGIDPLDLYGAWCALVPPVPNELSPSGYACGAISGARNYDGLDDCAFQFATSDPMEPYVLVPVDCGIFELCSGGGPCTCTASACGPYVIPSDGSSLDNYPVVVDAAIDPAGTMLTGTLAIKDGVNTQRITIRMQRAP
jgi:hypothetical protein